MTTREISFTAPTLDAARSASNEWALANGSARIISIDTARDGQSRTIVIKYKDAEK